MKFEPDDIEIIARTTVELLQPLLSKDNAKTEDDVIFDVQGLADYLKTSKKWVYEQTHLKTIPYLKLGNKQVRFRKSEIDSWLKGLRVPAAEEPTGKRKLIASVNR